MNNSNAGNTQFDDLTWVIPQDSLSQGALAVHQGTLSPNKLQHLAELAGRQKQFEPSSGWC